ncbi:hypothetical protein [Oceanisphaera psychrotolerans]|uniref:Uncharacterized protein n=1 Tax=Oceanisphaera psychrotolerans TaxID=1414654 RepID=A0A1J4QIA3_9GAMM|nr:hypothetical protein [Oceanisphaera psychrotolerans]OIN12893.1 hypothetical protein BFR47_10940 [Oceanisphaera psychrotolerans]
MQQRSRILIIEQEANPSTDFFVRPGLNSNGDEIITLRLDASPSLDESLKKVIFVRYITPQWQHWVEQNQTRLSQLVFFMDDDLFDLSTHAGLPLCYRWKLYRLAWRHQAWLKKMGAELWVSTPWLAKKYASWSPLVCSPQSPYTGTKPMNTLFYHGSASHRDEFEWLYPVVEQVLKRQANLCFELIGNGKVHSRFSALPRVHVLHPMKWPAYQTLISRPGYTIGLAPLLENRFNAARAQTKFFDITQAGAVGIYTDHPVYRQVVRHQHNGLLLPMEQQAWIEGILQLTNDEQSRRNMLENATGQIEHADWL